MPFRRRSYSLAIAGMLIVATLLTATPVDAERGPQSRPPDGTRLVAVDEGGLAYCAIRATGHLVCWARDPYDIGLNLPASLLHPPTGTFTAVSAGGFNTACAIQSDGRVDCWGADYAGMATPPNGEFIAIAAGEASVCGIRANKTIACWGLPEGVPPSGTFTTLAAGQGVYCAIRTDQTAVCWGNPEIAPLAGGFATPGGMFAGIGITFWFRPCGIRPDATLECWGDVPTQHQAGEYAQVDNLYGLLADGTVVPWLTTPIEDFPGPPAPSGHFRSISGECGIALGGVLDCWLDEELPPTDTTVAAKDPAVSYGSRWMLLAALFAACAVLFRGVTETATKLSRAD